MGSEEIRDYFPFCVGKFVSLRHGRILRLKSENSTENQAGEGFGRVSKVFIQNLERFSLYRMVYRKSPSATSWKYAATSGPARSVLMAESGQNSGMLPGGRW